MTTNQATHANSAVDYYEFKVEWEVSSRLPEVRRPWTEMDKIAFDENTTTRQLRLDIKDRIQRYFENCEDFRGNDIKRFMSKITENHNEGKARSNRKQEGTFWVIRFWVTIFAGKRTFQLDSGIWQRVSDLSDIISPKDHLKLHVKVYAKECNSKQRGQRFRKDTDLAHHVYPRLQELSYYKVGTVQNTETRRGDVDLLATRDKAKPLERKNVILARYEEMDEDEMCKHFRILNSWRISTPDGTEYFSRIGNPEGGIVGDMQWLTHRNIHVTTTYQSGPGNPSMTEFRDKIAKERHANRFNTMDQESRQKEVPQLPSITLNEFPKSQLKNASNELRDGENIRIITRVVYLLPALNLEEAEARSPQNARFKIDNEHTFWHIEQNLFDRSVWTAEHNRIPAAIVHENTDCVWWIMDPRKSGDIGKMYRVDDSNRRVCRYIPDAPNVDAKNRVLYTECHVRPKTAPVEYTLEGE